MTSHCRAPLFVPALAAGRQRRQVDAGACREETDIPSSFGSKEPWRVRDRVGIDLKPVATIQTSGTSDHGIENDEYAAMRTIFESARDEGSEIE